MKRLYAILSALLMLGLPMEAQMLLVDRGVAQLPEDKGRGIRVGSTKPSSFVGDHFKLGLAGEIWIMDTIRLWTMPEKDSGHLGDVYEKVALFGGIESAPPDPGQPDCDCHNLIAIRTAVMRPGTDEADGAGMRASRTGLGVWQVDFRDLRWSVPGGVQIQFGANGAGRADRGNNRFVWRNRAAVTDGGHQLRVFDKSGKLEGPYTDSGSAPNPDIGINVQVWGHKVAPVVIRSTGSLIEVALQTTPYFNAATADVLSLRFGPKKAIAVASRFESKGEQPEVVVQFRRAETGIRSADVNACLTGIQRDGVPFEGCDLLKK